ncbi:ADP-sugar diphosphatase [Zopfia rhizophila CBS 207.26]|uniref:ADP-sugar diphosphatase n=1 Tax=Zopfia rhizophila CBS 207.26 TaxID=1314779 RepID=A0A6A6E8Z5_9PEZI|nr:ADP-sugar diphosphatase [Zopfia rhizophila CBS 207.26]
MSTFTLKGSDPSCTVHLTDNLTKASLENFPAFKNWIATLQHSLSLQQDKDHTFHSAPYKLRKIDVQAADWFGEKKLGFVKLQAEVTNDNEEWLPGAVFLRGGSVGMLIILQPDDVEEGTETDKHVLLTVQPRIAAGSLALAELPAGMLDDGTFSGKAAQEIFEETHLEVPENHLINMTDLALSNVTTSPFTQKGLEEVKKDGKDVKVDGKDVRLDGKDVKKDEKDIKKAGKDLREKLQNAMYPSPGACDEFIPLFLYQKRVPRSELDGWRGKLTGLRNEGEKITIKLVKLEELWKEGGRDAKALAALALYEGLKREGKT